MIGAIWLMDYSEKSESYFQTYRQLEQSELIRKGWVPVAVPESAYEIRERHRVDQPYVNVLFRFRPGDTPKQNASCTTVPSHEARARSYRCKHGSDYVMMHLRDDGTGAIRSE
jgi:hypothetical protein